MKGKGVVMGMFNINFTGIRARIVGGLALILLISILSAVNSIYQNKRVHYEVGEIAASWIPAIDNLGRMKGLVSEHYVAVSDRMADRDKSDDATFAKKLGDIESTLSKATEVYAATLLTYQEGDPQADIEKGLYKTYQTQRDIYLAVAKAGIAGRGNEAARAAFSEKAPAAFHAAYVAMEAILKFNLEGTAQAATKASGILDSAETVMLGALGFVVITGVLLVYFIPRSVMRPVRQAMNVAHSIADGDLTNEIHIERNDELGELLTSLRNMQARLSHVVTDVRHGSEAVANASGEIAHGNNDLSRRTEQQASSLEETASSMELLGETVRQNADNARQANQLALNASTVAKRGGEVVDQVVSTMRSIHESSSKIADIIGVIDGIAFQTNILALNAAVEAARAGEQGRGFAVVASEVRSLAGRSAQAAKEIKTLIGDSVERVQEGTNLVDRAGTTMQDIVASINRVTDIVGEISSASSEQSNGVSQVVEAVNHMDQATQQNAALVEEIAAAASGLSGQATDLVRAVAVFKVNSNAPALT